MDFIVLQRQRIRVNVYRPFGIADKSLYLGVLGRAYYYESGIFISMLINYFVYLFNVGTRTVCVRKVTVGVLEVF